ncbi:MAG TPA: hypothetical protein VFU22_32905 [Roseiflexaceae bacterium]|nr:hypothetical protein [Roseiflexaceae bacterium]
MTIQTRGSSAFRRLWLSVALMIVGAAVVGFFGLRAYHAYTRLHPDIPASGMSDVEAIRGWMTLPYIARSYRVPEDSLWQALDIPKAGNARLSLKQLVAKYARDPLATRQAIQQVLLREQHVLTPSGGVL